MARLSLVLLLAIASVASASSSPAFCAGRSAELLVLGEQSTGSFVVVPTATVAAAATKLADVHFSDLVAHIAHSPAPLPKSADQLNLASLPSQGSFFAAPRLNLLVVIDSLASQDMEGVTGLSVLGGSAARMQLEHTVTAAGNGVLSTVATLMTGAAPACHGIVSDRWLSQPRAAELSSNEDERRKQLDAPHWMDAFTPHLFSSHSRKENLLDVASVASSGESMMVTFAGSRSLATAMSVSGALMEDLPASNSAAFYYSHSAVHPVYATESGMGALYAQWARSMTHTRVLQLLQDAASLPPTARFDAAAARIHVADVVFDLNIAADLAFVVELLAPRDLLRFATQQSESNRLLLDNAADFFCFAFASLPALHKQHKEASHMKAVVSLIDHALHMALHEVQTTKWDVSMVVAAVAAPSEMSPSVYATAAAALHDIADPRMQPLVSLPFVNLRPLDGSELSDKSSLCNDAVAALHSVGLDGVCGPAASQGVSMSLRALQETTPLVNANSTADADNAAPKFHIIFWSSWVLGIIVLAIAYCTCAIGGDVHRDSLLFHTTNTIHMKAY